MDNFAYEEKKYTNLDCIVTEYYITDTVHIPNADAIFIFKYYFCYKLIGAFFSFG